MSADTVLDTAIETISGKIGVTGQSTISAQIGAGILATLIGGGASTDITTQLGDPGAGVGGLAALIGGSGASLSAQLNTEILRINNGSGSVDTAITEVSNLIGLTGSLADQINTLSTMIGGTGNLLQRIQGLINVFVFSSATNNGLFKKEYFNAVVNAQGVSNQIRAFLNLFQFSATGSIALQIRNLNFKGPPSSLAELLTRFTLVLGFK